MATLITIMLSVPKRPQFGDAYYALQRRFESGNHELQVTEAQYAEIKDDPVCTVTLLSKQSKAAKKGDESATAAAESEPVVEPTADEPAQTEEPKPETKAPAAAEKPAPKGPGRRKATT